MAAERKLKVGVRKGGGPPPGFKWSCLYLAIARNETLEALDESQYHHLVEQFQELARHDDPTRSDVLSVEKIEDFHELRDKGGPLGKMNVRVFFLIDKGRRAIVVLGFIKKEADGKTPHGDIVRIRRRKRRYEAGDFSG